MHQLTFQATAAAVLGADHERSAEEHQAREHQVHKHHESLRPKHPEVQDFEEKLEKLHL